MRALIALSLIAQLAAPATPQQTLTFKATSELVVVNVAVTGSNGDPVEGLTASDFIVTEDGKPQQLKVFEYQRLEDTTLAPATPAAVRALTNTVAAIAPAGAGEIKYQDHRLLVMFFDLASMPVADQIRAQSSALKFLTTQMTASDLVAVMTYSTTVTVLQDFTADRDRLIGEVRDAKGALQGTVRDDISVKLKGESVGQLATRNLEYDTGFTLPPGEYTLKFLARENETGKIGTFETKFEVPDLAAGQKYLPISSVVLGYQREKLDNTLATAERDRKLIAGNPLVEDNQKLVPSVTRVFRKDQEMYVYLEAYQPAAEKTQPLLATVSFYRGKAKAFEAAPLEVTTGLNPKSKAVPIRFSLPLEKLQPGRYVCQVSVIEPSAQKFAVWRSAMVLLP